MHRAASTTRALAVLVVLLTVLASVAIVASRGGKADASTPHTSRTIFTVRRQPRFVALPTTTTTTPPLRPYANRPVKMAFLGDSIAWSTAVAVSPFAAPYRTTVLNDGIWGCGVVRGTPFRYFGATYSSLPNDCDHWPDQWRAMVDAQRPDIAVIFVGRWELMDRVHDGRWTSIGDPAFTSYLASELNQAVAAAGSRGAKVILTTTPYYHRGDAPNHGTWPEDDPARTDMVNALLRWVAGIHPDVAVVDFGGHLSPGGHLAMTIDGVRVRTDGVHIASGAGGWLAPWLLPQIRAASGY